MSFFIFQIYLEYEHFPCNKVQLDTMYSQRLDAVEPEGGVHERVPAQLHFAGQRVLATPVTATTRPAASMTRYTLHCVGIDSF